MGPSAERHEHAPRQPGSAGEALQPAADRLLAYFAGVAPQLLRPPEGLLEHPSIAFSLPGRAYSTTLWDWDTLWTTQGLFRCADLTHDVALRDRVSEHARGSLLNFLDHQGDGGRIPIMLTTTDPDPFGFLEPATLPDHRNQAKPVFGQLALLISDEMDGAEWVAPHFDKLLRFYDSWARSNQSQVGLLVWGDDVAIGNDNDPSTFGRPFFSSANLLLNTLFYRDLQASTELAARLDRHEDARRLADQAETLGANLVRYCWDPRDSFFYTVDTQCVDRRAELIKYPRGMDMSWACLPLKVQTFTGFLPLWSGLATPPQADALVRANYLADVRFRCDWGVRSLSSMEGMYDLGFSSNPSNWLGPVWVIVNYVVWKALQRYGFASEARELAARTIRLLAADVAANGTVSEFYHPDTGLPVGHRDYMDWNLLVLEMI